MNKMKGYSPEVRERAVRLVFEHQGEHDSQWVSRSDKTRWEACSTDRMPPPQHQRRKVVK